LRERARARVFIAIDCGRRKGTLRVEKPTADRDGSPARRRKDDSRRSALQRAAGAFSVSPLGMRFAISRAKQLKAIVNADVTADSCPSVLYVRA